MTRLKGICCTGHAPSTILRYIMNDDMDFSVSVLGKCSIPSPIILSTVMGDSLANYVTDDEFVRYDVDAREGDQGSLDRRHLFEKAGPRQKIYFAPSHVHAPARPRRAPTSVSWRGPPECL